MKSFEICERFLRNNNHLPILLVCKNITDHFFRGRCHLNKKKTEKKNDKRKEVSMSGSVERDVKLKAVLSAYLKARFVIISASFSSRSGHSFTLPYRREKSDGRIFMILFQVRQPIPVTYN